MFGVVRKLEALTVIELREILRSKNLSITGNRSELVARIKNENPDGSWLREYEEEQNPEIREAREMHERLVSEKNSMAKENENLRRLVEQLQSNRGSAEILSSSGNVRNNSPENNNLFNSENYVSARPNNIDEVVGQNRQQGFGTTENTNVTSSRLQDEAEQMMNDGVRRAFNGGIQRAFGGFNDEAQSSRNHGIRRGIDGGFGGTSRGLNYGVDDARGHVLSSSRDDFNLQLGYQGLLQDGDNSQHVCNNLMVVNAMSDLLSDFDGVSENFESWERQVNLLIEMYELSDKVARVLIGKKLKGKALAWFHSKPEHIQLETSKLLIALRRMFFRKIVRFQLRKQFEN